MKNITWQELLVTREKAVLAKEELEASIKVINDEMLERLKEEKINGKVIDNYSISKATRYSFDVDLKKAKELGAVKEMVDQALLKQMYFKGVKFDGIKTTEYILVREVIKDEN